MNQYLIKFECDMGHVWYEITEHQNEQWASCEQCYDPYINWPAVFSENIKDLIITKKL